jgi:hypothetical protein
VTVPERRLYVDCTAHGGATLPQDAPPVFDADTINLFMVRPFQPLFSAALIAHLEACIPDDDLRQSCTRVTNFHDTPAEYLAVQEIGFVNQGIWNKTPEIMDWINGCRLNAGAHLFRGMTPNDTEKLAVLGRMGPLTKAAVVNIPSILAAEQVA